MSIVIVLFYFGVAWHLVGRDPKKNALPSTDQPPEGFCPAAAHYLWTLGDIKFSVATALLSMAVKGFLTVEEVSGLFCLQHTGKTAAILSPAEQSVAGQLFPHEKTSLILMRSKWVLFGKAEKALKQCLRERLQDRYFHSNIGVFSIGVVLSIGLFVWQFPFHATGSDPFLGLLSTAGIAVFSYAGAQVVLGLQQEIKSFGGPGLLSLFVVGSSLVLLYFYGDLLGTMIAPITMAALALINAIFFDLLKVPTPQGREILDQLEGLRLFLEGRQGDSMDSRPSFKANIQQFERYLPYAIVLGREEIWIRRCASAPSKAKKTPEKLLKWYRGNRTWDEFGHSFSYCFYSAVRRASTAPSSPS
jgi:hypothetical protein